MKKEDLIDFLVLAAQQGASDLHLTPGSLPMIRVAGVLKPLTEDAAVLSAEETRRLVIDALKEGQRSKLKTNGSLTSRCRFMISAGIAGMPAMCQVRLRRISDRSLPR